MPSEKEPREPPADQSREESQSSGYMSLVDYFDQMDRDAFRRSLEYRDGYRERHTSD